MSDLISRQAAIDALIEKKIYRPLDSDRYVIEYCMDAIKTLPAADAVPVVRCRDCKYNRNPPSAGNALCDNFYGMTDQNGFCHFGERRIDG